MAMKISILHYILLSDLTTSDEQIDHDCDSSLHGDLIWAVPPFFSSQSAMYKKKRITLHTLKSTPALKAKTRRVSFQLYSSLEPSSSQPHRRNKYRNKPVLASVPRLLAP